MESSDDSAALQYVTGMEWSGLEFRILGLTYEVGLW